MITAIILNKMTQAIKGISNGIRSDDKPAVTNVIALRTIKNVEILMRRKTIKTIGCNDLYPFRRLFFVLEV